MEEIHINILSLLLVLIAAWLGGTLSRRLGYPNILGELIIGIVLGPGILGLLEPSAVVKVLSEVGIILLMVYIGIEIDFNDLKKASWPGLLAAIGGFIVPFVFGYFTIVWFGGTPTAGLFVAIAVGVTSLATKSRILVDLKLLDTRIAYVLMSGALISDTLALVIFAGIVSFADAGSFNIVTLGIVALKAILFFVITIGIGIYVLPRIGSFLSKSKLQNSTLFFTIILIVTFGYSELAELAGMHNILGAFMAGLFIKDSLFPKNISKEVHKTFYDVSIGFMAPIFFVSAGFAVNVSVFQTDLLMMLVVIVVAVLGKILGTMFFYLPSGYGWREGITVGAGMNGRGAVEIIIAGIGLEMGIISQDIFSILIFMAIFTTTTVPFMLKWTTNWLRNRGELVKVGDRKGFLFLGVNPISLLLARHLKDSGPITMIDSNQNAASSAKDHGFMCVHGNGLKEDVMAEAKAEKIDTFIALTGNNEINILGAQLAKESFLVPNNHVTLSHNEGGAGPSMLDSIKATSLFSRRIRFEVWLRKISDIDYHESTAEVKEKISSRAWVKSMAADNDLLLPLVIVSAKGSRRPFHYGDILEPGEKVIYLH